MVIIRSLVIGIVLFGASRAQQFPAPAQLLRDINATPTSSPPPLPHQFMTIGVWTYFVAADATHGTELFRTFGTTGSTSLVADIRPGPDGSYPAFITAAGTRVFFVADDGIHGPEWWVSDGTPAGTSSVADLVPGADGIEVQTAARIGTRLLFFADLAGAGVEPWITDGTAAGTALLADINPGPGSSFDSRDIVHPAPTPNGSTLVYFTSRATGTTLLWGTDGTPQGTRTLGSINSAVDGSVSAVLTLPSGITLFLVHYSVDPFTRLWATDGSARGVAEIARFPGTPILVGRAFAHDGRAWFGPLVSGGQPIVSDGTAQGTLPLTVTGGGFFSPSFRYVGVVQGELWGLAPWATQSELYRVDSGNLQLVHEGLVPTRFTDSPRNARLRSCSVGSRLLLIDSTTNPGEVVSISFPTRSVARLGRIGHSRLEELGAAPGHAYAALTDSNGMTRLFQTDGTVLGTTTLGNLGPGFPAVNTDHSTPRTFSRFGRGVAFAADAGAGRALWFSDGTEIGTRPITPVFPSNDWAYVDPVAVGSNLFFAGTTPETGEELWITDGTPAGTRLVGEIVPGPIGGIDTGSVALGHELMFTAGNAAQGRDLYSSDGSSIRRVWTHPAGWHPYIMDRFADEVLVRAWDTTFLDQSAQYWAVDAALGTARMIGTFPLSRAPDTQIVYHGRLYVARDIPGLGPRVLSSDGLSTNFHDHGPLQGPPPPPPLYMWQALFVPTRDRLWVMYATRLWSIDPETLAMVTVPTIPPPATAYILTQVGSRLLVAGNRGGQIRRLEVWAKDLAAQEWEFLRMFDVDLPKSSPVFMTLGSRHILFNGWESGSSAPSLWITDGTAGGTRHIQDLDVLTSRSNWGEARPLAIGGNAYLCVLDDRHGAEPFVFRAAATTEPVGSGCGGRGRVAQLDADGDPVFGASLSIHGSAPTASVAVPMISPGPRFPTPFPQAGRCELWIDPAAVAFLAPLPAPGGRFAVTIVIPNDPALRGLEVAMQVAAGPTDAPLGFDLTNGLILRFGD